MKYIFFGRFRLHSPMLSLLLLVIPEFGVSQTTPKVVSNPTAFKQDFLRDERLKMVELKTIIPNIQYELKYATKDNFTKTRLYPSHTTFTFLRKEPAEALKLVANELAVKGLGILVWDAYRPYHVTQKFWELIRDERYVAHPSKGSGHNRGIAIDMTLYNINTGQLVEMPTSFDDFSEKAHHGYENTTAIQKQNRELLRTIMEKHGFIKFQTEWWHYYWPNGNQYDVLDFTFTQIKKINSDTTK